MARDPARVAGRRLPRLHAVTDDSVLVGDGFADRAAEALEAGGADLAIHLRGRNTDPRALLELVDRLLPHARRARAALLVNDRVDVALVTGTDGVHLGRRSLPAGRARAVLGAGPWIGVSCHGPGEVEAAAADGADYAFLGTIHPTASHAGAKSLGIEGLEGALRRAASVPLIGIGGIGPAEAREVVAAGAYGVAAIRGIWHAPDPARAVREYLEGLGEREGEDLGSDGHHSHPAER